MPRQGAWPVLTVLGGEAMVGDCRFHDELKYLKCRITEAIRRGSARRG